MEASLLVKPERTYSVRIQAEPIVQKALIIEQGNRQIATGTQERLIDIASEWMEEKARAVIEAATA